MRLFSSQKCSMVIDDCMRLSRAVAFAGRGRLALMAPKNVWWAGGVAISAPSLEGPCKKMVETRRLLGLPQW